MQICNPNPVLNRFVGLWGGERREVAHVGHKKVQSLASNPHIVRVASVICHYGVNRLPDSQLVKSLSAYMCVCVCKLLLTSVAAQFIAVIRFSFIACVSAAHWACEHDCTRERAPKRPADGWTVLSSRWDFFFFIHSENAVEYRVASKRCLLLSTLSLRLCGVVFRREADFT